MKSATSMVKKSETPTKRSTVFSPMWSASRKYGAVQPRAFTAAVGRGAGASRLGAYDVCSRLGLVPDRHDLDAELLGREAGGELGFGFVGEAVAHAEGEFTDDERLGGHTRG
jgi:hypothetical protein